MTQASDVFRDLDRYVRHPRIAGLALSPDGSRLVTSVATVSPDGKRYVTALWDVDPAGVREPRRLTRSAPGELLPAFLPDGSLLFTSKRPDPDAEPADDEVAALWLLPADGGEARQIASPPGGVNGLAVARDSGTIVFASPVLPGAGSPETDAERRKARKDADVSARLHDAYPIRYWDHDLGPGERRLYVAPPPSSEADRLDAPRDLTPEPGRALEEKAFAVSPDGGRVVTGWTVVDSGIVRRVELVSIDTATGERTVLASAPDTGFHDPDVSPDGQQVVAVSFDYGGYDDVPFATLVVVGIDGGEVRRIVPDFPQWTASPKWSADGSAVFFTADEQGRHPLFRADVASGAVTRVSADGAFTDVRVAPDGAHVYALNATIDRPAAVSRVAATATDAPVQLLPSPGSPLPVPGRVEEVHATAADGTPLRAWLALPPEASATTPVPLLLWIHGGPHMSWNAWTWRWNPWLMTAQGYAVLLPDPALSTGYGQQHIARSHGQWGDAAYTDLMTMTDAVIARPDIDESCSAAMGGSFGGYMANWIAGHTDRFRAIVTHASLWALDQFQGTTDDTYYWQLEFGDPLTRPERYAAWSPHLFAGDIRTPMLVIHGDLDDRVPIGEALRLWSDIQSHGVESRFLFFPDENHWVLKPNNAKVWYETVLAFLAEHMLGKPFERPSLV